MQLHFYILPAVKIDYILKSVFYTSNIYGNEYIYIV